MKPAILCALVLGLSGCGAQTQSAPEVHQAGENPSSVATTAARSAPEAAPDSAPREQARPNAAETEAFVKELDGVVAEFGSVASSGNLGDTATLNARVSAVRQQSQRFGTLLDESPYAECVRASTLVESSWRHIEMLASNGTYSGWREAIADDQKQYTAARKECLAAPEKQTQGSA
ncbi:hypothetical protein [Lysobacter sp. CA199]|uniref:hypothetical protein n=1 Tax=Lysobacter sp. CA199 TaxID=3455608 RepID=UPI003F8D452C